MAEKQITAKYAGRCKTCRNAISIGDQIFWEQGKGTRHVKCPENKVDVLTSEPEPRAFVLPALSDAPGTVITAYYYDGEYCSGWMVSTATESLEKLGLGHYLSGWGWKLEDAAKKALGDSFTITQAIAHAEPILRAKHDAAEAKRLAGEQKRADAFSEARRSNNPVVLNQWSEECDGSEEECDIDTVTKYAMPDGSIKTSRSHSY